MGLYILDFNFILMEIITNKNLTSLSLLVTLKCNLSCDYCYVFQKDIFMDFETGKNAIDFFLVSAGEEKRITFLGGEPLLNLPLVEKLLDYIEIKKRCSNKKIITLINTNGTILNKKIIDVLSKIDIIVISFDGIKSSNDLNRRFYSGNGTFDIISKNLNILLKKFPDKIILNKVISSSNVKYLYDDFIFLSGLKLFRVSILLAAGDHYWDKNKLRLLESSFNNLSKYFNKNPSYKHIIRPLEESSSPVCILSHLSCSPEGNFYPCEFLYFLGGESIGSLQNIKKEFIRCTFSEQNPLCKSHKCLNCADICKRKDFKRKSAGNAEGYSNLLKAEHILIKFKDTISKN